MEVYKVMTSLKSRTIVMCFLCLAFLSSCASQRDAPINQWFKMDYIVDGRVDIQFIIPPAKAGAELSEPQFISTVPEPGQSMLFASYDPGSWGNRGLLLTRITSTIIRIEREFDDEPAPSLDYIRNDIYLSRDDAKKKFDIMGEVYFDNYSWLRVNLISGYRRGISYSTLIGDDYVLILTMSMYGEESDKTNLFRTRHETLKKVINSVKISTG